LRSAVLQVNQRFLKILDSGAAVRLHVFELQIAQHDFVESLHELDGVQFFLYDFGLFEKVNCFFESFFAHVGVADADEGVFAESA